MSGKITVFLVDDDDDNRRFLKRLLSGQAGYEVWSFATGTEAIEAMVTHRPDAVVSDLDMPGLPGEAVARTAAQLSRRPRVVLMSGDARRLERARSLADHAFLKPFSIRDLIAALAGAGGRQPRAASPTGQDTPVPPSPQ
jgi:two-component system KDP operon response regulator KdpE